ncbi:MAG: response regulator [bacterium]
MKEKSNSKILIVEDTEAISRALSLKLEESAVEVITTSTGQEAVELIGKNNFKVILLDLVIPDVNGFSILETLNNKKSKAQLIVLSNLSQKEDIEKAKTFGVKEYFIKSDTSISKVVEYIKSCLKDGN